MKLSIVTISFNQVAYLRECLESITKQDYFDLEHIVVDAGSTDGSRELLQDYCGHSIRLIFEKDEGPADGLRKGFEKASGDVLFFLNADDKLVPGVISSVMRCFKLNKCDWLCSDGYTIMHDSRIGITKTSNLSYYRLLYRSCVIFQQGVYFTKEVYNQVGGINRFNKTCWDYELFLKIARDFGPAYLLPERTAYFRLHDASISGSGRVRLVYQEELNQIFQSFTGFRYGKLDSVITFWYRVLKKLKIII